jgi:hypothetical protein
MKNRQAPGSDIDFKPIRRSGVGRSLHTDQQYQYRNFYPISTITKSRTGTKNPHECLDNNAPAAREIFVRDFPAMQRPPWKGQLGCHVASV